MTTLALLGLLVVLLVAIGIAAFLLRGRKRDDGSETPADEPPRTVRDLVNRRRELAGNATEDGDATGETDTAAAGSVDEAGDLTGPGRSPSDRESAATVDGGPATSAQESSTRVSSAQPPSGRARDTEPSSAEPSSAEPSSADRAVDGTTAASTASTAAAAATPSGGDTAASGAPDAGASASDPDRADAGEAGQGRTSPDGGAAGSSDVDAGPVGPPWSRGFVDGRPIEPPGPVAPRRARPTPHARTSPTAAGGGAGTGTVDSSAGTPVPATAPTPPAVDGPDTPGTTSPGATEPGSVGTGVAAAGVAVTGAAAAGATAAAGSSTAAGRTAGSATGTGTATGAEAETGTGASIGAGSSDGTVATGEAGSAPAPTAPGTVDPPRQESRSPVDPDLVKRVTAVPPERSPLSRTTTPDTEREFREARDRITGPGPAGRVPEQGGPVGATASRRPSPMPVPDRDRADQQERSGSDTSSGSVVTGAGIVAGTLGLGAAATGIAASRVRRQSTEDTTPASATSAPAGPDVTGSGQGHAGGAVPDTDGATVAPGAGPETSSEDTRPALRDTASAGDSVSAGAASSAGDAGESPGTPASVPGPQLGPTGEPAPRPTPRLMRSPTPVTGSPDDADSDDDPDAAAPAATSSVTGGPPPAPGGDPIANASGPDATISAMTATGTPTTTSGAAPSTDTDTDTQTDTAEPAERGEPAEPSPVVAFRRPRPERAPVAPSAGAPGPEVEVRVAGRDAQPVGGVAVAVRDDAGDEIGSATTDAEGLATLRVPGSGQYVVVSSAQGYQSGVATCPVADGPARVALTVTRSAAVHGVVRSASGSPVAGVAVTLDQDGETVGRDDTGADGAFRIADLGAGYYLLAAGTGTGAATQPLRVAAEADLEQDLRITR